MSDTLACTYSSLCSGCDWLLKPYDTQKQLKESDLRATWATHPDLPSLGEVGWVGIAKGGLRDRADVMIDSRSGSHRLGLFSRVHREIVDLQGCPQMSPALESWLRDFRRIRVPVQRGSVRLRVSPSGQRGVWLDLANIDVKTLLDDRSTLEKLRALAIVEIGQRRKRLVDRDGRLKLDDPILEPWFETYVEAEGGEQAVPLFCTIGSFTQPGFEANRALVGEVRRLVSAIQPNRVAEFGSGIGNFTLPLASVAREVHAYEVDRLATEGLRRSLAERSLDSKVAIFEGNFQVERKEPVDFKGADLILVDPPRSGLMKFLDPLEAQPASARPRHFVYVSCFAESFVTDAARLHAMGYELNQISIVDQFPQSRHYEIVAGFSRQDASIS